MNIGVNMKNKSDKEAVKEFLKTVNFKEIYETIKKEIIEETGAYVHLIREKSIIEQSEEWLKLGFIFLSLTEQFTEELAKSIDKKEAIFVDKKMDEIIDNKEEDELDNIQSLYQFVRPFLYILNIVHHYVVSLKITEKYIKHMEDKNE